MKSFKSKKSKVLLTCLALALIVSMLCVSLAGCKSLAKDTPIGVYFVGDFQRNVSAEQLAAITKEGEQIISIEDALTQAGIDKDANPAAAAAAIYAVAVTNYNNVTQTGYYVLTDALVNARGTSLGTLNVGIRSTYSSFSGKKGSFSQTISGVTKLEGIGPIGDTLRTNFGYNIQSFGNDDFYAFRRGSNGGAQFPAEADDENIYKYILGAYNNDLTGTVKAKNITITPSGQGEEEKPLPDYAPVAGQKYPAGSTLADKELPAYNLNRKAWEPLNRIPARYWDDNGNVAEVSHEVEGTIYNCGTYGAGFAVYDFSRPEYLSNDTKVSYDSTLDLWTVEIAVLDEYTNQACEFAAGDLIKDTKSYIALKNAKFTKIAVKFEVYGNGLIKSMQKNDELSTTDKCPLVIIKGECKDGGLTSNTATMAFSYSDNDTDAVKLAALYWPELGQDKIFNDKGVDTKLKLDLSSYPTFDTYKPVVNDALVKAFNDIFAKDQQ